MKTLFKVWRSRLQGYGVAVLAVVLVLVVKLLLDSWFEQDAPFSMFFAAVMVSAYYGGRGAGVLAIALATLAIGYFFLPLFHLPLSYNVGIRLGLFIVEGLVITSLIQALHNAKQQAEVNAHELQISEERYRRIVDTANEGIWLVDRELCTEYVNQCMADMLGYETEEMIGRSLFDFMDDEARRESEQRIERRKQGLKEQFDFRFCRRDGSDLWVIVSANPTMDEQGEFKGAIAMLTNVTERKQTEDALKESRIRLELLNNISTGITLGMTVEQIIERTVEQIGTYFKSLRVIYATIDDQGDMRVVHTTQPPGIKSLKRFRGNLTSASEEYLTTLRSGKPIVAEDVTKESRLTPVVSSLLKYGTRASLDLPLQHSDQLVGLLCFDAPEVHHWSHHEIATLTEVAEFLSLALKDARTQQERRQAEESLRESEERFRTMADAAPVMLWMSGLDQQYYHFNKSWLNFTGRTLEQEIGHGWAEGVHPEDLQYCLNTYTTALETCQDFRMEYRLRHTSGEYRWILNIGVPRFTPNGNFVGYIGSCVDIHQHKRAEEVLRFLAEASGVLSATLDFEATFASLAQLAVPDLADYCIVDLMREEQGLSQVAVAHVDPTKEEFLRELRRRYPYDPNAANGVMKVIRTGQPEIVPEIQSHWLAAIARDADHLQLMQTLAFKSYIIVPLRVKGEVRGAVSFVSAESKRRYGLADLVLAEELARRASLAIANASLYREAQEVNRMKDEFLAVLSHELRSPLNAILGWSRLLRTRQFDASTVARALETIERNANSQSQLIEDLLDVSRMIQGKLSLHIYPVNLIAIIEAAIDTLRLAAEDKAIKIRFVTKFITEEISSDERKKGSNKQGKSSDRRIPARFDQERTYQISSPAANFSPFLIPGDPNRLQQVISNLLSNAIKFTPEEGQVEVRLSVVESNGQEISGKHQEQPPSSYEDTKPPTHYAQITVSDTGPGISSDFLPYIFERFRQADSTTTRSHGGLGLGLAIVRHLVELHNGTIQAANQAEEQGAIFTVHLPLPTDKVVESAGGAANETSFSPHPLEEIESFTPQALTASPAPMLKNLRILIVEDEVDSREFLATALRVYGAEVAVAESVEEAIASLTQAQPDVLISDIGMPHQDGYTLMRRLRILELEQGKRIPAVAVTAYVREEDRQQILTAGFQKHLPKPIEPVELATVIADLINH